MGQEKELGADSTLDPCVMQGPLANGQPVEEQLNMELWNTYALWKHDFCATTECASQQVQAHPLE